MKLVADPMPILRVTAGDAVNAHFNRLAAQEVHRDQAHKFKRDIAQGVINGVELRPDHPFRQEADMRGMPVEEFASMIVLKPDVLAKRELERQRMLLAIAAAKSPAEISAATTAIDTTNAGRMPAQPY